MSFPAMAWAVRQKLPCTQKIVLMMLAERHNKDTGQCNPSHDLLADDCGLTRRSVMDQVAKLAEAGYLRIRHRAANNVKLPNQYILMFSFGVQEEVKDFSEVVNDVHQGGATRSIGSEPRSLGVVNYVPGVVNDVHQGSEPGSHKPGIEPGREPKEKKKSADAPSIVKADSSIAKPEEISQGVWSDFLSLRKEKRAKLTNTALAGIKREADKAGWTLESALAESCARGWTGFKAEWVADKGPAVITGNRQQAESFAERDARNGREAWERMTGRQWPAEELPGAKPANAMFIDVESTEIKRLSK